MVIKQAQLRRGGGIGVDITGDESALGKSTQALEILDNGWQTIVGHLLIELPGVEPKKLPAAGLQVIIASIVLRNPARISVPRVAIGFDVQLAGRAMKSEVEGVIASIDGDKFLPLGAKVNTFELSPKPILQRAVVIQVIDLFSLHELTPSGRDEHDTTLLPAGNRARQTLKRSQEKLVVTLRGLWVPWCVREQLSATNLTNFQNARVVVDGKGFWSKHFGLIEGQPLGRPPALQPFLDALNRDAVPVLITSDCQVVGMEHFYANDV